MVRKLYIVAFVLLAATAAGQDRAFKITRVDSRTLEVPVMADNIVWASSDGDWGNTASWLDGVVRHLPGRAWW